MFIGPALIYYTIFIIYPLMTFYFSLNIAPRAGKWSPLCRVAELWSFDDEIFFLSAKNTILGVIGPAIEW
jgi:hypothetical protein